MKLKCPECNKGALFLEIGVTHQILFDGKEVTNKSFVPSTVTKIDWETAIYLCVDCGHSFRNELPNYEKQFYKGIPLRQIARDYFLHKARRFVINDTNQNIWIPCAYLDDSGTIKEGADLDFIFKKPETIRKLEIAGVTKDGNFFYKVVH
jgi:hypothetical protein